MLTFHVVYPEDDGLYWSENYHILFVLRGRTALHVDAKEIVLQAEDFLIINPCSPYQVVSAQQAVWLCMEVDAMVLQRGNALLDSRKIACSSVDADDSDREIIQRIRKLIANIFAVYSREEPQMHLRSQSKVLLLFDLLLNQFSTEETRQGVGSDRVYQFLRETLQYIHDNFRETVLLDTVAAKLNISASYLSRLLRSQLGQSFSEILFNRRMKQAVLELEQTDKPITEIAYNNGFPSSSAFISRFKERFGCTPFVYRKQQAGQSPTDPAPHTEESVFQSISKYMDQTTEPPESKRLCRSIRRIECDLSQRRAGEPVRHNWKRLANIGWAVEGLSAEIQKQISMAQQEIGFEYLRFHGIFSDDLMLYNEDENGNPTLNFVYCDLLLDFLQSIGLKPYLELGFVPQKLASHPERQDLNRAYICMPKDWDKWDTLVHDFSVHCIRRYGIQEVRTWRFTPIMCNHILYDFFTWDEYTTMYDHVWTVLKQIDPQLLVGGPGIDVSVLLYEWDRSFGPWIEHCRKANTMPDFITLKFYPYDHTHDSSRDWEYMTYEGIDPPINRLESLMEHGLKKVHALVKKYGYSADDIVVEAWNSAYSQKDPCNDICYKSAFIAKSILETLGDAWSMGYWVLSDHMVDFNPPRSQSSFRGGGGLITYDGICKSGYYAMKELAKLKGNRIQAENGYLILQDEQTLCIVAYQYCAYNLFHRKELETASDICDPYYFCLEGERQARSFAFRSLAEGTYTVERFVIGPKHGGNPYEVWQQIGEPENMTSWMRDYVSAHASPQYQAETARTVDGILEIRCVIDPHDVHIIRITPSNA